MDIKDMIRDLIETRPPPVSGDYGDESSEMAAIEARDFIGDWYRSQLRQLLHSLAPSSSVAGTTSASAVAVSGSATTDSAVSADADILSRVARDLTSQDNAATADPIFMVQQRRRVFGFDPAYSDRHVYVDEDSQIVSDFSDYRCPECDAQLDVDDMNDECCRHCEINIDLGNWCLTRTVYQDFWEHVQPFFTRAGAEEYIRINGHNLCEPRIYVESAWRNAEWQAVRRELVRSR